jgi:hypothetical protein
MTFERKIVVSLGDIKAVVFECDGCRCRVVMNPDNTRDLPGQCPECRKQWIHGGLKASQTMDSTSRTFLLALTKLRMTNEEYSGFQILFELEEPRPSISGT